MRCTNLSQLQIPSNWDRCMWRASLHLKPYFISGEIDVNLRLSDFLINGLSSDMNIKKSIIKYLQGKSTESSIESIFNPNIHDWRDVSYFLSSIDERTMHCMNQIGRLLDSNSWKIVINNPVTMLSKKTKERIDLFFGSKLESIQINENGAQWKIREHLRCNFVKNMIR